MSYDTISTTNLANYIPSIWSQQILAATEHSLVTGGLFDRSYETYLVSGGRTIVVPHLAEISANLVNTAVDATLYDAVQNATNINVNCKYDIAVMVDDLNQMQTNPKYFEKVKSKLAYGLSKQIDINCNVLFKGLSNTVGTINTATTEDTYTQAYEYLNAYDAPYEDRAWVIDPETVTDLLKLDYFVQKDYNPSADIHRTGFRGQWILGSPIYITTNLDTYAGGPHAAAYFQREALALVLQMAPRFEVARIPLRHADALIGVCMFGVSEMRDDFAVRINTRS